MADRILPVVPQFEIKGGAKLISHYSGRGIVSGSHNAFDVAILMDGLAVLVGGQISL